VGDRHAFQLYLTDVNRRLFAAFEGRENFEFVEMKANSFRLRQALCRAALLSFDENLYRLWSGQLFAAERDWMEADSDLIYTPTVSLLCFNHRKPTLLSMHDMQYLHYPQFFNWLQRRSRAFTCTLSARSSSHFQASSQFIRRDMLASFPGIAAQQISVIPEGVKLEEFAFPQPPPAIEAYCEDRFLFLPAQLWPHKNHKTVLRALFAIEKRHGIKIPLLMTGAKYSAASEIFRYLSEHSMSHVRYLGIVPFQSLVALYQHAALVISPGFYESNSLPVLEAAAAGTAVIASRIPPNEELAETLRLNLFDPLNEEDLAERLLCLWQNPDSCREQARFNQEAVARFSWENAARQYLQVMEQMLAPALPLLSNPDRACHATQSC
jgi:glycosyltransferase involved in cell wall biosynthesis